MTDSTTSGPAMAAGRSGAEPAVRVIELVNEFAGGIRALDGVNFDVPKGELTSVTGPSGCGKATTLKVVAGLVEPTSGTVEVNGVPVTGPGGTGRSCSRTSR